MKKLFNIFKKKKEEILKPEVYYSIGGKIYAVKHCEIVKYQPPSENHKVYGWTLEVRTKRHGEWGSWFTYYNNKIYNSHSSALGAALQCHLSYQREEYEWRIKPLYVMDDQEIRDYKIDLLLKETPPKKQFGIKAWKVIDDCEVDYKSYGKYKYKKGTVFIQLEDGNIINLKDRNSKTERNNHYQLKTELIPRGLVKEVDIQDEKWAYPHLLKELKKKLL
jgi:hypothetical protein